MGFALFVDASGNRRRQNGVAHAARVVVGRENGGSSNKRLIVLTLAKCVMLAEDFSNSGRQKYDPVICIYDAGKIAHGEH